MMERPDHINPWADKLQDVRIPDMQDAWRAMELRLDEDMPRRRGGWRRWMLLIILLLLLIGVCNCPGLRHHYTGYGIRKDSAAHDTGAFGRDSIDPVVAKGRVEVIGDGRETQKSSVTEGVVQSKEHSGEGSGASSGGGKIDGRIDGSGGGKDSDRGLSGGKNSGGGKGSGERKGSGTRNGSGRGNGPGVGTADGGREGSGDRSGKISGGKKGKSSYNRSYNSVRDTVAGRDINEDTGRSVARNADTTKKQNIMQGRDTAASPNKGLNRQMAAKQGADSIAAANKKTDTSSRIKGWMVGIGLNQFFTVGQQKGSDFNSNGTTGGISDYIPVPMVRYYFNEKLFVQLEAQINTPQYTKKDLVAQQSKVDSITVPNTRRQTTVTIKKLFYFNVPLSIHYSPVRNLSVGAGIQYSRLTNGVGLFEDKGLPRRPGATDTLITSKVQSFKQDTLYQKMKTQELRLLFDVSYIYKHFIIGARYNRALKNYLDVEIPGPTTGASGTQVVQARNSQLQLYIRYILWDGRKKKTLLTK